MRDYLAATRDRVVVFDGGMGATLEQFDLSLEHDYKLPGPLPTRRSSSTAPTSSRRVHASMVEAGAEVVETDTFQASRLKLEEWGLERPHARDQPQGRRDRPQGGRRAALRRRLDRPDRPPPRVRRPDARPDPLPRARRDLRASRPAACSRAASDLLIIETAQDILEVKAAIFGAREAFKATGRSVPIQASVSLLPNGGKMLLGTDIAAVLDHARGAQGRRDRPELLDRPGGHARRDPLPRRVLARARPLHPERRHPAPGPRRRDDLPRGARPAGRRPRRVRRALRRRHRRRLLRHDARAHRGDRRARAGPPRPAPRPAPRAAARQLDDRPRRRSCRTPRPTLVGERVNSQGSRKAKELLLADDYDGLVAGRRGPGRGRRPRARPLRRADRAPGRGRADAARGQARLAHAAGADPGRLDRARRHRDARSTRSRAARSSTRSTSRPAATSSTASRRSRSPTAPR